MWSKLKFKYLPKLWKLLIVLSYLPIFAWESSWKWIKYLIKQICVAQMDCKFYFRIECGLQWEWCIIKYVNIILKTSNVHQVTTKKRENMKLDSGLNVLTLIWKPKVSKISKSLGENISLVHH